MCDVTLPLPPAGPRRWRVLAAAILLALPWLAFWPAVRAGYIWDDDFYIYANPLLRDAAGLMRIWTDPAALRQYYPLTHTSFWLEYRLWGLNPLGYHVNNILLHGLSAVLVWRVLHRLLPRGAWLAAVLFAVHPVHVESVVWATERKNTLAMLFALLAILGWLRFLQGGARRWYWYGAGLVCFLAAMLAKTVVAVLPAALLIVLLWQRPLPQVRRSVAFLAPWFVLGIGLGLLSVHFERVLVGAQGDEHALALGQRILLMMRTPWFYAGKLAWPDPLIFIYERWPEPTGVQAPYLLFAALSAAVWLVLLVVTVRCLCQGRRLPGAVAAVGCYLVLLFPASGLFNVYPFRYAFVADHFQYHASVALLAAAGWGLATLGEWLGRRRPIFGLLAPAAAAFIVLQYVALAVPQARIYFSQETLWVDTIRKNPNAAIAWNNLATWYAERGDVARSRALLLEARQRFPADFEVQVNLAQIEVLSGNLAAADATARDVLRVNPRDAYALSVLGQVALARGDHVQAERWFGAALALRPADPDFRRNLEQAQALRSGSTGPTLPKP